ncbi:MAG: hypothetical protein M3Z22_04740 [Verrucomicrobiota bacterium]|nr:hypothetical protein [Verrucomicrobiota bacterium]
MKRLVGLFALVSVVAMAGCANDGPTSEEVGQQVGRGLRGEGRLSTDVDRSDDPYVKPREGAPGPRS